LLFSFVLCGEATEDIDCLSPRPCAGRHPIDRNLAWLAHGVDRIDDALTLGRGSVVKSVPCGQSKGLDFGLLPAFVGLSSSGLAPLRP
jgi:hypothetical protein